MKHSTPGVLLDQVSKLLAAETGLYFPTQRWNDLERGLAAAAAEMELPGVEACVRRLLSDPWNRNHEQILVRHLTVGETYFFRHRECFSFVEDRILPKLIQSRSRSGRWLRIWCAGCCTGEEAYSIAILLHRLLPDWKDWSITILATDVNAEFLQKAQGGMYRSWSFRGCDPGIKRQYFTTTTDGRSEILPEIRSMVKFAYLNLARDRYPSPLNGTESVDLIFCRNVLMYFVPEQARYAAAGFFQSLVEGGWLIVSPSESSHELFHKFTPSYYPDVILYRRLAERSAGAVRAPQPEMHLPPEPPQQRFPAAPVPEIPQHVELPAAGPQTDDPPPSMLQRARNYANEGKLTEALECCDKAVADDRLSPSSHYLRAAILQERGMFDDAAVSLRRALYLDRDFALAHFALGNLCRRQGQTKAALRHFENALRALRAWPPDEALPEADGITARRLTEIIQSTVIQELGTVGVNHGRISQLG